MQFKFYQLIIFSFFLFPFLSSAQSDDIPLYNLYDIDMEAIMSDINNGILQIELPFPDGTTEIFDADPNQIFSEEMAKRFPNILTFNLRKDAMKGKLTIGNGRLYVHLRTPQGMMALQPSIVDSSKYKCYYGFTDPEQADIPPVAYVCEQNDTLDWNDSNSKNESATEKSGDGFNRGGVLTTYRLAVVTTGEFEDENGANSMLRITNTVQAWNLIYEVDLGVTLSLVNTQIYSNPASDPFIPDGNGGDSRTNQAAEVLRMNFADNTYDVGHVFHNTSAGGDWSGGGVAGLGVVCSNNTFFSNENPSDGMSGPNKSAAWSGSFNNTGNGWIQLSAHELGHQFNASHTFNGSGFNCQGGNVPQNDAYEIASGTTLMSYNGLCGNGQNIPDSGEDDNYFHASSLERMINYITFGIGSNCGTDNNIANTAPIVDASPNNPTYTIPINTPFELTGLANDAENDDLTYCWEQYDEDGPGTPTLGKIGAAAASDPLAPLFRSFPPTTSSTRTFPSLTNILAGNNTGLAFEALPSVDRSMTFALTVRDNNPIGGSIVCDNIEIDVEDRGGAFGITSQNTSTTLLGGMGSTFTVTWNVAGTTGGNIQCAQVDILFSTDGGDTFPIVLANNTANDGNASVSIPNQITTEGRIKVICSDNIFFDINNADITITNDCEADGVTFSPDNPVTADEGDSSLDLNLMSNYNVSINNFSGTLATSDPASNLAFDNLNGNCFGPSNSNNYDVYEFITDASGNYTFTRSGTSGQLLNLYLGTFNPNNVCNNWLGSTATRPSGSGSVSLGFNVTVNLATNTTYSLVVSTFDTNPARYGNYNVTYNGSGQLFEEVQPDPGFAYTYVIVNDANNNIVAFEDDPDLRSYSAGNYTIYGLERTTSISTTSLNNDYTGGSFNSLQSDINAGTICGDLSTNTKSITINDAGGGFPNNVTDDNTYDNETVTVQACQTIIATSDVINSSNVTFIAGQSITLKNGFLAENSTFIARVAPCPPVNSNIVEAREKEITKPTKLNIYPNPTTAELFLDFNHSNIIKSIKLYDQLGRKIRYWQGNFRSIPLADLANGMYIVLVETEEQTFKRKIIKQ